MALFGKWSDRWQMLSPEQQKTRKRIILGGCAAIVALGLVGLGISALSGGNKNDAAERPTPSASASAAAPTLTPTASTPGGVVDASVTENGWIPEPITTDAETYAVTAAEAVWSYDSKASTREEFMDWMETWFAVRGYLSPEQKDAALEVLGDSLRYVVPDADGWNQQALAETVITAEAEADKVIVDGEHREGYDTKLVDEGVHLVTVPVNVRYEGIDVSTGEKQVYNNRVIQSMQVVCGQAEIAESSSQPADSCKIWKLIEEPRS